MPRRRASAAAVATLVAATVLVVVLRPDHRPAPRARPTPAAVAAPSSTPRPTPTPTAVAIQQVRSAVPTRFTMTGPAAHPYSIRARVCGMPYVRPLDPPGEQHHTVCWVKQGFGVAPGSTSATTYLLGHAWSRDRLEVMNPASVPATEQIVRAARAHRSHKLDGITVYPTTVLNGSTVRLRTRAGVLTYTVKQVYGVAKNQAGLVRSLMDEKTPRRLVIITCAEAHGIDYDYDVIINAYLTTSRPLPT